MKQFIYNTLILLTATIMVCCDNGGDCKLNNVSYYRTGFYSIDGTTGKVQEYQFPLTVDASLMINGKDSIVAYHLTQAKELTLPMCYTQETDTVILHFGEITKDTLFVKHTNIPYFISMDCGMGMYHNLNAVEHTKNLVDSAVVIHKLINFDAHENIKLYIAQ